MKAWEAARNALESVLDAVSGESIIIICDDEKNEIGQAFADGALALGLWTRLVILETGKDIRKEIPPRLLEILTQQKPNIFINLMRGQREETPFRIRITKLETRDRRSRLGHCPGVSMDMLTDGALSMTSEKHREMQGFAQKLLRALEGVTKIDLHTPSGTKLSLSTDKREFYTDTKLDWKTMKWMNLPTGEVLVAPVENSLTGHLVCDMAIGGVGPLKAPVELTVKNGQVIKTASRNQKIVQAVKDSLATDEWGSIVGEFAFGINPEARFVQEFLEAEKIMGTVHIAFGDNLDYPGGKNPSKNHMDFLMSHPSVKITRQNGESGTILQDGNYVIHHKSARTVTGS